MKTQIICAALLAVTGAAFAIEPAELDARIQSLATKFDSFQRQADKAIPQDILRKARGIVLLDGTKAGFIFAYHGGSGVAMVKEAGTDKWSPAAFLAANEASLGFQIGGEQHFCIMLLMTTNAAQTLVNSKIDFSGEARGTAGDQSSGVATTSPPLPAVLVYDDRQGLYGGAAVKGGAIAPDADANRVYYGQYVTMNDILFSHRVQRTEAASRLAQIIDQYAQPRAGQKTANR